MNIALITYPIETNPAGVGINVKNIVQNLLELDRHNTYFLLHFIPSAASIYRHNEILYKYYKYLPVMFSDSWYISRHPGKFDIVHRFSPGGFVFKTHSKIVITVNDLFSYKKYSFNRKTRSYLGRYFIRSSLKKAQAITTLSQFTKEEILKTFELYGDKVHVVPCAPGISVQNPERAGRVLADNYGITYEYILFVSTIEPRKNLIGLVNAYERLREKHSIDHYLVIVGKKGWDFVDTLDYINKSKHKDHIKLAGFVPASDLACFYKKASLFVYPSLMEGFGIPPLEAMKCGCPTLTSNTSSLPEVVGHKEMMFDPADVKEIANKCLRILKDPVKREENIKRGLKNVERFSWRKSAEKLIRIYNNLA